jgi:glycosyltransferase involved in cell wall biosynthesis
MNILVVIPSLARGGAERAASRLTQHWVRSHSVKVALFDTSRTAFPCGGDVVDLAAPARRGLGKRLFNIVKRVKLLRTLIQKERPDRIVSFMEAANIPTVLAALAIGYRPSVTVTVHNNPDSFPAFYRFAIPLLYRLADEVVPVSRGIADALTRMGVPGSMIRTIPNPIDISADGTTNEPLNALWADRRPYVLSVGRLHRQKGFDRLIEAFKRIARPDLRMIVAGDGPERPALEEQVRHAGLAERVRLVGAVDDPFPAYRNAECFVMSSRYEGWPNVLLEAMNCGCPVISFDCEYGPAEIIEHGVSGLLIPQDRVDLLATAVETVLSDRTLRRRLGTGAKQRAARFSVPDVSAMWWRT